MKMVYFAWVREKIGKSEEDIALGDKVKTVRDLLELLKSRDTNYAHALENIEHIRVAIDQNHVEHDALIKGAKEIALFPPMTGG